jgi:hypothetical protein
MLRALYYGWRVLASLLQILIVLFVFSSIHETQTILLVAILGIIYTTIRGVAYGRVLGQTQVMQSLADELLDIKRLLGDASGRSHLWGSGDEHSRADIVADLKRKMIGAWIDWSGLSIIGLICLFQIFTHL